MEILEPAADAESSASLYAGATLKSQRQSFEWSRKGDTVG